MSVCMQAPNGPSVSDFDWVMGKMTTIEVRLGKRGDGRRA